MLTPGMEWYGKVEPVAREIAARQHFEGIRWMKMTDPSGQEAPSSAGSFLIWQQPHYIYMAELIYRQEPTRKTLERYPYDCARRSRHDVRRMGRECRADTRIPKKRRVERTLGKSVALTLIIYQHRHMTITQHRDFMEIKQQPFNNLKKL
jgi:hypothetical protein